MSSVASPETHEPSEWELASQEKAARFELLHRVGIALTAEKNRDRLVEMILLEAKHLCGADGGTLYIRTDKDTLRFTIMRTDSLNIADGGTTGREIVLPEIPLYAPETGEPNLKNVATAAALLKKPINIPDAYDAEGFDFSGTKVFDERSRYRSKSILTIPLFNSEGQVIAVLQLLNARSPQGEVIAFSAEMESIVLALASQAGIALDNQLLLDGQRKLLESFIKLIASAIDAKSPYTGGHCARVPVLTEMLAESLCRTSQGAFADFKLDEEEWYELRIAAWLHDCGKVVTPVHVMDKATKLETISDRIELIRERFEVLKRDVELKYLKLQLANTHSTRNYESERTAELKQLNEELAFLEWANIGGEFLAPEHQARIRELGARQYIRNGKPEPLLSADEIENLSISRGTLTEAERIIINSHMVQTIQMLEALPFPRNLARVPEYAGGHHEKMDGKGYPKGIYAGDMSIPARIMAIADVFEALTADDRPYKPAKRLSEAMHIMGEMKRYNHLDPALFDHFVAQGVYRQYAEQYLAEELRDAVDEAKLLAIRPEPFALPPQEARRQRWADFLPAYRQTAKQGA